MEENLENKTNGLPSKLFKHKTWWWCTLSHTIDIYGQKKHKHNINIQQQEYTQKHKHKNKQENLTDEMQTNKM